MIASGVVACNVMIDRMRFTPRVPEQTTVTDLLGHVYSWLASIDRSGVLIECV
jgi:hypothetical protein